MGVSGSGSKPVISCGVCVLGGCGYEADTTIATLTLASVSRRSGLFATMPGIPPSMVLFAGYSETSAHPWSSRGLPQSGLLHTVLSDSAIASAFSAIMLGPKNKGPVAHHGTG